LTTHVVVAADDFDMDGVRMRWKGIKKLHLPNPIPIAVLAAPPTKGGISQNYDGTEVSYSTSQGETYSYQTTTGHSLSLAVGVDLEDPTGAFGATAKVTLKGAVEKSETSASTVQTSVSFTGGYDQDVVIFQGTLQLTYVYEFVAAADPKVIGTEAAVNISLDTKVYKWTRTFFEDTFGSNSTLPADLFTHAIGDPSTYPTHLAAAALLQTYEGYEGETVTVGQGKGTNGVGLDLETVLTTGTQWSFEMEVEAEVKLGGPTFGITKGITNDWVWENVATEGTSYGAEIGDIQLSSDYFTWGYDAGLFTYARTDSVKPTVQVVSFWTEPWGGGY
jgi:hypothetical protein